MEGLPENGVALPARHAYSHSASVGNRHPSEALFQVTASLAIS